MVLFVKAQDCTYPPPSPICESKVSSEASSPHLDANGWETAREKSFRESTWILTTRWRFKIDLLRLVFNSIFLHFFSYTLEILPIIRDCLTLILTWTSLCILQKSGVKNCLVILNICDLKIHHMQEKKKLIIIIKVSKAKDTSHNTILSSTSYLVFRPRYSCFISKKITSGNVY